MSKVRYKQGELPSLTEERKAELQSLADQPDSGIYHSDIPQLDDAFWARSTPNPFFKPVKIHASVRIDADCWPGSKAKARAIRPG